VNVLLTISSVPVEAPIIINGFEDWEEGLVDYGNIQIKH
jgi:hypothetical protein